MVTSQLPLLTMTNPFSRYIPGGMPFDGCSFKTESDSFILMYESCGGMPSRNARRGRNLFRPQASGTADEEENARIPPRGCLPEAHSHTKPSPIKGAGNVFPAPSYFVKGIFPKEVPFAGLRTELPGTTCLQVKGSNPFIGSTFRGVARLVRK